MTATYRIDITSKEKIAFGEGEVLNLVKIVDLII